MSSLFPGSIAQRSGYSPSMQSLQPAENHSQTSRHKGKRQIQLYTCILHITRNTLPIRRSSSILPTKTLRFFFHFPIHRAHIRRMNKKRLILLTTRIEIPDSRVSDSCLLVKLHRHTSLFRANSIVREPTRRAAHGLRNERDD